MFGRQGVIPGITDGNPASMAPVIESDWFGEELYKRQRTEELYRKIDSNERLQKLMSQNTSGASDAVYFPGDLDLFKEKSRIRETKHLSTDADSSTDTTVSRVDQE